MSDKVQNENIKNVAKMVHFCGFYDILDIFSCQNKDIDMIPSKERCQAKFLEGQNL